MLLDVLQGADAGAFIIFLGNCYHWIRAAETYARWDAMLTLGNLSRLKKRSCHCRPLWKWVKICVLFMYLRRRSPMELFFVTSVTPKVTFSVALSKHWILYIKSRVTGQEVTLGYVHIYRYCQSFGSLSPEGIYKLCAETVSSNSNASTQSTVLAALCLNQKCCFAPETMWFTY